MGEVRTFLQCLGEAALTAGPGGLARPQPEGSYLAAVADEAMRRLRLRMPADELRNAVEEVGRCPPPEVRLHAADIVDEIAGGQPAAARRALGLFLVQVPPSVRRALQRPDDPGAVQLPAGVPLRRGEDLLPLLPGRLPMFQPGETAPADDRWVLQDLLGVGGFGEVWKAQHRDYPTMFSAFKFCTDAAARRRLLAHEGKVVSQVMRHGKVAGIVPLLDADIHADPPWLRYEYIEGGDLAGVLRTWMQSPGRNRVEQANRIIGRLAKVVGHFHRLRPPVIHRDLKPANVLVQKLGPGKFDLRIADFGIGDIAARGAIDQAKVSTVVDVSLPTQLRGAHTPRYASPQQKRGEAPDVRDDVYALGVIWYQLLVQDLGRDVPSGLDWVDELKGLGVSEPVIRLLADCLAANADKRPADAGVLAERLRALQKPGDEESAAVPAGAARDVEPILLLEAFTPVPRAAEPAPRVAPKPARPVEMARPVAKAPPVPRPARAPAPAPSPARRVATAPPQRGRRIYLFAGLAGVALVLLVPAAIFHRQLLALPGVLLGRGGTDAGQDGPKSGPEKVADATADPHKAPSGSTPGDGTSGGANEAPAGTDPPIPPSQPGAGNLPPNDGPREAVANANAFTGTWKASLKQNGVDQGTLNVVVEASQVRIADDSRNNPLVARYQLQPIIVTKFRPSQGVKLNYEGVLVVPGATHENWVDFEVRDAKQMTMYCPVGEDFPALCRGLRIEFTR